MNDPFAVVGPSDAGFHDGLPVEGFEFLLAYFHGFTSQNALWSGRFGGRRFLVEKGSSCLCGMSCLLFIIIFSFHIEM